MINIFFNRISARLRLSFEHIANKTSTYLLYSYSRNEAHSARRKVVRKKGVRIVDHKVKSLIKKYCRDYFGKESYWPHLALYTEIRGEFIRGWIPEDYYWLDLLPKWNPYPHNMVCNFKTFDYRLFGDFVVKPVFSIISGQFFNSDFQWVSMRDAIAFLNEYNSTIVVKEEFGRGGKEVYFINSLEFEPEKLSKRKNYVIQPFIEQYKVLNELYPGSVNTFRVNTFIENDGSISIRFVMLRFGANGSKVDNLASGGKYLFLNSKGVPSEEAYDKLGFGIGSRHENTGYRFLDLEIPMYELMLEKCKDAHRKFPYVRLIGWDVCIDKTGVPRLLEWNADRPHLDTIEAKFGPLFPDFIKLN